MIQNRTCQQCNIEFLGGPRAYYCPDCRKERQAEANARHRQRKKIGSARRIGAYDKCKMCGEPYMINSAHQRHCSDCAVIHAKEHDRTTGLIFYHENKEKINPVRNEHRRIGSKTCEWCGNEFETHNSSITCSDECKRMLKNHKWNMRNTK